MIGNSTYIREFTPDQRKQLERVQEMTGLKTVPDLLFHALEGFLDGVADIARLNRLIEYKQKKIERIQEAHAGI